MGGGGGVLVDDVERGFVVGCVGGKIEIMRQRVDEGALIIHFAQFGVAHLGQH